MKKFISLFLVFSLLGLSGNLFAKERKGAELIIQKKDGQELRGELIAVKENSLLLLDKESGADVSVNINKIILVTGLKKSNIWKGAGIGLLIGGGLGAGFGALTCHISDECWDNEKAALGGEQFLDLLAH